MKSKTHVVICGFGNAGTSAYKILKESRDIAVTIVDTNASTFNKKLVDTQTTCVTAKVVAVDTSNNNIKLKNNQHIPYDYLILALGSRREYCNIPGAEKNTLRLDEKKTIETIQGLFSKKNRGAKLKINIIGNTAQSGELAKEILHLFNKDFKLHLHILEAGKLGDCHSSVNKRKVRHKKNIQMHPNTNVKEIYSNGLRTQYNHFLAADLQIWMVPTIANQIEFDRHIDTNSDQRIPTNKALQLNAYSNIFVAGDVGYIVDSSSEILHYSLKQIARNQGKHAAKNIQRVLKNKKTIEFRHTIQGGLLSSKRYS